MLPTGAPWAWGRTTPPRAMFQGLSPGRVELLAELGARRVRVTIDVRGLALRDGEGRGVDLTRSHASIERTPPMRDEGGVDAPYDDFDALRVVMAVPDHGPGLDRRTRAGGRVAERRGSAHRPAREPALVPFAVLGVLRRRALLGERAAAPRDRRRRSRPPPRRGPLDPGRGRRGAGLSKRRAKGPDDSRPRAARLPGGSHRPPAGHPPALRRCASRPGARPPSGAPTPAPSKPCGRSSPRPPPSGASAG